MATSYNFDGSIVKLPSVRSVVKSGQVNPTLDLSYGSLLVIDTGRLGASWGGGAGISGTLETGKDTLYEFDSLTDFRNHVKGGLWWKLAKPLFIPSNVGINGISKIIYIRAAATVPAELTYTFTGDGNGSESVVNGGTITLQVRDEGLIGNGSLNSDDELQKGYAGKMFAGVNDTSKFILKFYRGTFRGTDSTNNTTYDNISAADTEPEFLVQSPEFSDFQEFIDWAKDDFTFNTYFKVKTSSTNGDGTVDNYDLLDNDEYKLASGGTETYSSTHLETVLDAIKEIDYSFILADDYGSNAQSANNFKIYNHVVNDSKFKPELYIAGGDAVGDFAQSKLDAAFYDKDTVTVVHGAPKIASRTGNGFFTYPSIYKAAICLGREAGKEPQIPLTFKDIAIDGEQHPLTDKEAVQALDAGLLVSRLQGGRFEIIKGVNSLQKNKFLVNDDGSTHSKQIKRITRQLNKEIIVNAENQLLRDEDGVNRNTLSALDVKKWLQRYLKRKIATPQSDNLILDFQNITVTRQGDAYRVNYEFTPNSEINFIFVEGLIISV